MQNTVQVCIFFIFSSDSAQPNLPLLCPLSSTIDVKNVQKKIKNVKKRKKRNKNKKRLKTLDKKRSSPIRNA